jgi:hypothetical protein
LAKGECGAVAGNAIRGNGRGGSHRLARHRNHNDHYGDCLADHLDLRAEKWALSLCAFLGSASHFE